MITPRKTISAKAKIIKPLPVTSVKRNDSIKAGAEIDYGDLRTIKEETEWDIYLIHEKKDEKRFTDELCKFLRRHKLKVWYNNIVGNIGLEESMVKGIKMSKRIAIFISKKLLEKIKEKPYGYIGGIELVNYKQKQQREKKDRILIPIWDKGIDVDTIYRVYSLCSTVDDLAIRVGPDGKTPEKIAEAVKKRYSKDTGWIAPSAP